MGRWYDDPAFSGWLRTHGRLFDRLHSRYDEELTAALTPEQRRDAERLRREDSTVVLIGYLFHGIEQGDLTAEDIEDGLELARAGKLLKSSAWLLNALTEYRLR